jgi:hypothetical protein
MKKASMVTLVTLRHEKQAETLRLAEARGTEMSQLGIPLTQLRLAAAIRVGTTTCATKIWWSAE